MFLSPKAFQTKSSQTKSIIFFYSTDHPHHSEAMLAGMWGFYNSRDRYLAEKIFYLMMNPKFTNQEADDQKFLKDQVFGMVRDKALIHDSYFCRFDNNARPFPSRRSGSCFVGDQFDCDHGLDDNEFMKKYGFTQKCPLECRPSNHQDWEYC